MGTYSRDRAMEQIEVHANAESRADAGSVFALLRDGATWPKWSLFDKFELEQRGSPDPLGVGAIRVFVTRVSRAREQVVELIPGRRLSYTLLSGFPFRDYRANVDLEPLDHGGTLIHWHSTFHAKHFGTGWFAARNSRRRLQTREGCRESGDCSNLRRSLLHEPAIE